MGSKRDFIGAISSNADMATTPHLSDRKWPRSLRIVRVRWRLCLSGLLGLIGIVVMPGAWRLVTRMLISWDIGVGFYLALCIWMILHSDMVHIRRQSVLHDEGRFVIPVLTVTAALASLAAILIELRTAPGGRQLLDLALGAVTILLSWSFIHTIFAFHYAHEFYAEHRNETRGVCFPGDDAPDYWDFIYFSFVIGMSFQVSDVAVKSKAIRKTVTVHSVVSFIFNVTLLALAINLAATAI
jgi:uncharacterized membrane protein